MNKPKQVSLGKRVCLDRQSSIFLNQLSGKRPIVRIGNNVLIGAYSSIGCSNEVVIEDDVYLCHVGDSRIYLYDRHCLKQVTKDHTLVNELIERGAISIEEGKNHRQKNVLMQAIGVDMDIVPEMKKVSLKGRNILICSDGLYNNLTDQDILQILCQKDKVENKVKALINEANAHGGSDNIAVVLIEGGSDDE